MNRAVKACGNAADQSEGVLLEVVHGLRPALPVGLAMLAALKGPHGVPLKGI